jgi:hypothetical protein
MLLTKSANHCITFNTCMIVISDVYVLVVHLLNACPHKLLTLANVPLTVTKNMPLLGDYRMPVEPPSA